MNDLLTQFTRPTYASTRRHLADQLREMILSDKFPIGYKFPSNKELSDIWRISSGSVQTIMSALTREGLLERTPKLGTFVAERSTKLMRVGIYLWHDIWGETTAMFARTLVSLLNQRLDTIGVETEIIVDTRGYNNCATPWPELIRAVDHKRIQALLVPEYVAQARPWISRLSIPWVEWARGSHSNRVVRRMDDEVRLAVEELMRMGCKSVGMISPEKAGVRRLEGDTDDFFQQRQYFRELAEKSGLRVENAWFSNPKLNPEQNFVPEGDTEYFGYNDMKRILALPDRPDGLFVTHDWVSRGALTAILENRIAVPEELKLVFFRNAEIKWVCPIPASFLESSIAQVASAMIDLMHAQLRGEDALPRERELRVVPADGTADGAARSAGVFEEALVGQAG